MSQRLNIDASIVGYWGFDEADEANNAIDASSSVNSLAVTASDGVAPGRVGNARHFNGSSSFATITSASLRLTGDLTLMVWAKLGSYNGAGTQLRAIVSCGGPLTSDGTLYGLSVTLLGALRYSHTSASGEVIVATANGVIRTGQYYFIQVRRVDSGGNQTIELYVDNVLKPTPTVTVNGVAQAQPVPPPVANASAVFSVGRSQKEANSAFWDGYIDELSVHIVARAYHAYLIDAYYRGALRSATTKLSATNTVVAVSSYEMGSGVRWWCVERDKDLYVVKESPFGSFGSETRLTTVGGGNSSLTGSPELLYDAANDVLYVFFVSGNRIYKLTATSTDDPATVNMPFTADTGLIIKAVDLVEGGRLGDGGGQREFLESDIVTVTKTPLKMVINDPDTATNTLGDGGGQQMQYAGQPPHAPSVAFVTLPTYGFGFIIGPVDSEMGGYAAYEVTGGAAVAMSAPVLLTNSRYFVAVSPRTYGRRFVAEVLSPGGGLTGVFSDVLVDRFTEATEDGLGMIRVGHGGDASETATLGDGGGQREFLESDIVYVNRTPLKMSLQDPDTNTLGDGGGQTGAVTQNGTTVVL
jgi:hypothetical protein